MEGLTGSDWRESRGMAEGRARTKIDHIFVVMQWVAAVVV